MVPAQIGNWIQDRLGSSESEDWLEKRNPATGGVLFQAARSGAQVVSRAVQAAVTAQATWGRVPGVQRGEVLFEMAARLQQRRDDMARLVALETGKSMRDALGETDGAVALGRFMAGEGQRLYGRTTTSRMENRLAMTVRQPIGVAGLIVPANTPIANLAWKIFPALICGNAAVVKASEDAPATAWLFAEIAQQAGLPPGLLNVVQGYGREAGTPLVDHPAVGVISFTGSSAVGREIGARAGARLARTSLELGGKNPLVVCDDADLENALRWVLLSAFSNAGQRCASCSRILVFENIYDEFVDRLVEATRLLKVGTSDSDNLGPVINSRQMELILHALEEAQGRGCRVLVGGKRLPGPGYFIAPTLVDKVERTDDLWLHELFGPVACLLRVRDYEQAVEAANDSVYGLTACIHTESLHRAHDFGNRVQAGVVVVNGGTFGSEPHMPFGGVKGSGNGTREPGTEALDIYSNLLDLYIHTDPGKV
ncbi:aldehyde dehydrogenase [bacterium CPR1]|nr:aldehyde dehydrogenase [bacterium CPR1]